MANWYQSNKDKYRPEMMPNKHLATGQRPILQQSLQYIYLVSGVNDEKINQNKNKNKIEIEKESTNRKECNRLEWQIMNEEARYKHHKMLIF